MSNACIISATQHIQDCVYVSDHEFTSGAKVPIYDVPNIPSLNQMIGYIKFINRESGAVYYRGQAKLHPTMCPSLFHGLKSTRARQNAQALLNGQIERIKNDDNLCNEIHIDSKSDSIIIEAMLQHYGGKTKCIDVVDNHWIALWFGLNKYFNLVRKDRPYATYRTRATVPPYMPDDDEYQYLIMVCADRSPKMKQGVVYGECVTTVDLRYALPSTFIRPHAQHGLVLKKVSSGGDDTFDLADRVVAILRMRTIDVLQWIGNGTLLTQSSLFPAPPFDFGYDILLSRQKELDLPIVWYVE